MVSIQSQMQQVNPQALDTSCLFSIEGNIGCGKSTLLQLLRSKVPEARWIEQPVADWQNVGGLQINLLERYYKEATRWGFTFQIYALFTRIQRLQEAITRFPNKVKIAERSILADKHVFSQLMRDECFMDKAEYEVFKSIYAMLEQMSSKQRTKMVYLRCAPKICHERTMKRKRIEENQIPLQYLEKIHVKHQEWFNNEDKERVLIIDANEDFRNDQGKIQQILIKIKKFMAE